MDTTVAVRGLGITKTSGDVVALDHVDLNVARGRIHGLVGPNGAGKTTLLGLLLGLAVADAGTLEILGAPVGRGPAAPGGVSGFVDGPGLYPTLTAKQNLATLAKLRHRDAPMASIGEVLEQVGLAGVADAKVRGFSLGMRLTTGRVVFSGPLNMIVGYRLQEARSHRPPVTEEQMQTSAICAKSEGHGAQDGSGNDWRCAVSWHVPGTALTGQAIYQLDVTANGRYIADGDGPQEVDGYFLIHTSDGDVPNPLWQFDGNVDLLPTH